MVAFFFFFFFLFLLLQASQLKFAHSVVVVHPLELAKEQLEEPLRWLINGQVMCNVDKKSADMAAKVELHGVSI